MVPLTAQKTTPDNLQSITSTPCPLRSDLTNDNASIPTTTLRDLRDRALMATLTYSFARIGAALKMKVEDLRPRGAGWTVRLHEKGGKEHGIRL